MFHPVLWNDMHVAFAGALAPLKTCEGSLSFYWTLMHGLAEIIGVGVSTVAGNKESFLGFILLHPYVLLHSCIFKRRMSKRHSPLWSFRSDTHSFVLDYNRPVDLLQRLPAAAAVHFCWSVST
jgi:hypothetical protein